MTRFLVSAVAALALAVGAVPAHAAPFALGPTSIASGPSPFAPGCGGPGEAFATSVLYQNAEVETHVAVNPTNANNVVAFWQQDRWSDGGAHGNLAGYSFDGGTDLGAQRAALFALLGRSRARQCRRLPAGDGPLAVVQPERPFARDLTRLRQLDGAKRGTRGLFRRRRGDLERAADLRFDNPRAVGNNFNDKETLTADPFDPSLVYATWQRIVSPSERASQKGYENAVSFYSEAWFARSTNGGESWEPARSIYAERGKFTQTIGNMVEVLPNGTLINGFNLIRAISNRQGTRGYNVALMRSPDKGVTWSREIIVNRLLV